MASETYVEGNTVRVEEDYGASWAPSAARRNDGAARCVERGGKTRAHDDESSDSWSDVHYEQIDGVVYQMAGTRLTHCTIVGNIFSRIKNALRGKKCRAFSQDYAFFYHPNIADEKKKKDFFQPDVMIACDTDQMKEDGYYGVPRFIVEVLSPSTSRRDRIKKMKTYAQTGVSEYWIVSPGGGVEVYYLVDGQYQIQDSIILCNDKDDEDYNADQVITLREFPEVSVTVGEIFE